MQHIICNRYASIYTMPMHDYRVGPSSPVVFVTSEGRYHGFYTCGIFGLSHMHSPHSFMKPHVMEAGQYGSGYPAVVDR